MTEARANPPIADAAARAQALDIYRSFIVQAPAGSGKTELLIQRFLALLAQVDAPEEIVAITFTRKAAAEMRARVLAALTDAQQDTPPEAPHKLNTWKLARAARMRAHAGQWELEKNPNRLRVHTIDALCHALARQMPVLSRFGGQPQVVEDPRPLYVEAAHRTLTLLETEGAHAAAVASVLLHLDNNVGVVADLLAAMLAKRDQWIRHLAQPLATVERRTQLEAALAEESRTALARLTRLVPAEAANEIVAMARHAARHLAADHELQACADLRRLPEGTVAAASAWRGIAGLLLTDKGSLRKTVNVKNGFPPGANATEKAAAKAMKARFAELTDLLREHRTLIEGLHFLRALPPAQYSELQWNAVNALTVVLPLAAAQLELLMGERSEADFAAVAQAALRALGESDEPTNLALALDYRIRHLLVDEFQDTAVSQFELLERLTAGWQADDGRTLFVVGDPMQSIYRFREAEVGLYLRARNEGIGTVALTPLTLSVNFRSQSGIVEWVNAAFNSVLADVEDADSGAVPYTPSVAVHPAEPGPAVSIHALPTLDRDSEAVVVVELIRHAMQNSGHQNVVLVRSRQHLAAIVPRLNAAGIPFQAIEIEGLGQRPVVQDLLALTRALLHPADRIAWLAVLRAPWCGLTLADLSILAGGDAKTDLWTLLNDAGLSAALSDDGRQRVVRLRDVLAGFLAQRRRKSLSRWVEGAWLSLGGPACLADPTDLEDAQVFFRLLDAVEEGGDLLDFEALEERVSGLFALPDTRAGPQLQLMTIHKAKGLEFDTVIVPGLGYTPRRRDAQLLRWDVRMRGHGGSDLLLAPIREAGQSDDPVYDYLGGLDDIKSRHEDARLLYVAATRAKSRLHLIGQVKADAKVVKPRRKSLLERLWPAIEGRFLEQLLAESAQLAPEVPITALPRRQLYRLPADWRAPAAPAALAWSPAVALINRADDATGSLEFSWASETAKHVGTVVHRALQRIAEEGAARWTVQRIAGLQAVWARELAQLGVPETERGAAVRRVEQALSASLSDPRGKWLLEAHAGGRSEYRLTGVAGDGLVNIVIDRTFVDDEGVCWIIDYKTSVHEGADTEAFLDNERERYRAQLERYALLMRASGAPQGDLLRGAPQEDLLRSAQRIRLGLYFPLLGGWREWDYEPR